MTEKVAAMSNQYFLISAFLSVFGNYRKGLLIILPSLMTVWRLEGDEVSVCVYACIP